MILFFHYFNFPLFSKPIPPIELGYHLKSSDEGIAPGHANDDCEDVDNDTFNWNPANILQNVRSMFNVKKKIHKTAEANIKAQQKRDKFDYDRKHLDPKVIQKLISLMSFCS